MLRGIVEHVLDIRTGNPQNILFEDHFVKIGAVRGLMKLIGMRDGFDQRLAAVDIQRQIQAQLDLRLRLIQFVQIDDRHQVDMRQILHRFADQLRVFSLGIKAQVKTFPFPF